jgi:hypothetical protein
MAFGAPIEDLDGNVLKNVDSGLVGFTGFDPLATQTLGAVATMLEKGILLSLHISLMFTTIRKATVLAPNRHSVQANSLTSSSSRIITRLSDSSLSA